MASEVARGDPWEREANRVAAWTLGIPPAGDGRQVGARVGAALGRDFSGVRMHTGRDGAARARAEGALAVTSGRDIYFGAGTYRPDHALGRALIGHELTHVAQQGAAPGRADAVGGHVRALQAGASPGNDFYRSAADSFRADRPVGDLAERRAALGEAYAGTDVTPAPPGMRQRTISCDGCNRSDQAREQSAEETPETPAPAQEAEAPADRSPAVAGPLATGGGSPKDPNRVVRLSWTLDDGPTTATADMSKALGNIPGTWFIMRNQLGTGAAQQTALKELLDKQKKGSEIAIHAFHPTVAHHAWYPVSVSSAVPQAYNSVDDAMAGLRDFVTLLQGNGITVKFVRFPGGEITELRAYLKHLGIADDKTNAIARKILRGENVAGEPAAAQTAAADHGKILTTLSALGLHLWGGSGPGSPMISAQSWEAEASPPGGPLTNDAVDRFKRVVDAIDRDNKPRSLVILAHDTAVANATAVKGYVADMDAYAAGKNVKIEFYTMSGLFQAVRGTAP